MASESKSQYPSTQAGYDLLEPIGQGAFGNVYRAAVKETKEEVGVKVLYLETLQGGWDEIRKEVLVMKSMQHANVVEVLTAFVDGSVLWIVMPLMHAGSCAFVIKKLWPKGIKDEALLATILQSVLKGLEYFHQDGKIHRDIKAGNILINASGEVKLADFGVAGTIIDNGIRKKRRTFTGTPCWMAPEVMDEHVGDDAAGYDSKADIWSFGITALELAFGKAPYADEAPMKVMLATLRDDPPTPDMYKDDSHKFSPAFRSLIEKCLQKKARKRPSASKLLTHRFFKLAKDNKFVVDTIVKKLPPMKTGGEPLNYTSEDVAQQSNKQKEKPVSVGEFVFSDGEMEALKQHLADNRAKNDLKLPSDDADDPDDEFTLVSPRGGPGEPAAAACESVPSSPSAAQPHVGAIPQYDQDQLQLLAAQYGGAPAPSPQLQQLQQVLALMEGGQIVPIPAGVDPTAYHTAVRQELDQHMAHYQQQVQLYHQHLVAIHNQHLFLQKK